MARTAVVLVVLTALAVPALASCGSSDGTSSTGGDRPVTTTGPLRTTLLETAPVTLPPGGRPTGVSTNAVGYEIDGTGGVWIEPNGDAVVVACSADDPSPAIRAAAIPGYRGIWTCI